MEAILIIFVIICICAALGKGWGVIDPNPTIDHESASEHVQQGEEIEKW